MNLAKFLSSQVLFACVSLLVAGSAEATPMETIPGAACQQMFDSSTAQFVHLSNGPGYNNTSNSMAVACPIQRQNPSSTGGIWAPIYVNNPAGQTTTCSITSTALDDTYIASDTESTTTAGWATIYITNVYAASAYGMFMLQCTLPPRGFIYEYFIDEE
jgi:hypothetical protein